MALGVIKSGTYGKYYAFNQDGIDKTLSLKDYGVDLTEEQLDTLIDKGVLNFEKDGETIQAKIHSFYNEKFKKDSICIKYFKGGGSEGTIKSSHTEHDIAIIESHKEDILDKCNNNNEYYASRWVNELLRDLKLSKTYYSGWVYTDVPDIKQFVIYFGKKKDLYNKANQVFTLYLKEGDKHGYKTDYTEISASQYTEELNKFEEDKRLLKENKDKILTKIEELKKQTVDWINNLQDKLYGDATSMTKRELLNNLEPIVAEIPQFDISSLMSPPEDISSFFSKFLEEEIEYLNRSRISTKLESYYAIKDIKDLDDRFEEMKSKVLLYLRKYYDYQRLYIVRTELYKQVKNEGLESVVDDVNIDTALDLGRFRTLKQALVKKTYDPIKVICMTMYSEVNDPVVLKTDLLNMLKVYYEFYNFPAKDIKALAKFVATHNMKEYQEKMLEYDEAIETILDYGSKDFKKKALYHISGHETPEWMKTKSYYFEKKAKVKDSVSLSDPVRLLEELRELIPTYNNGSDVAILTNIILEPDGFTFTYQFYTFSEDGSGSDMDGRRVQYMARLYNRCHGEGKLYFEYDK